MEGKIFKDSSNLYQDQAKVLFDYYKEAAEKIVAEEEAKEKEIENLKCEIRACSLNYEDSLKKENLYFWLMFVIIGLFFYFGQKKKTQELLQMISDKKNDLKNLEKAYEDIFRDYKVDKLGIAYVPVASNVPYNNKSFVVDHTGISSNQHFKLQMLRQADQLKESVKQLRHISKSVPVVEDTKSTETVDTEHYSKSITQVTMHDYMGNLDRTLRNLTGTLKDVDETNVELPVVFPNSPYSQFLEEYSTTTTDGRPVMNVFDTSAHNKELDKFNKLNKIRKSMSDTTGQVDLVLRNLMVNMADSIQATSNMKMSSVNSLIDYSNRMLFNILKASYNFYSPVLEAEEIDRMRNESFNYSDVEYDYKPFNLRQSSRVKFDLNSMTWVAEDGSRTTTPFGISQIQEEIIAPIVSNLMQETRVERLRIYNHIKDQKIDYLNQWHRDTEDFYGRNRAEAADLINLMRANLSAYSAAFNTLASFKRTDQAMRAEGSLDSAVTETEDHSEELLSTYEAQSKEFLNTQNEFAEYMERLHDDIDARAAKFGHIEYYDASLRDRNAKDIVTATDGVNELDDRRKPLVEVSPLLAKDSELPPIPDVEDVTYSDMSIDLPSLATKAMSDLKEVGGDQFENNEEVDDSIFDNYTDATGTDNRAGEKCCPECGCPVTDDMKECPECGFPLK